MPLNGHEIIMQVCPFMPVYRYVSIFCLIRMYFLLFFFQRKTRSVDETFNLVLAKYSCCKTCAILVNASAGTSSKGKSIKITKKDLAKRKKQSIIQSSKRSSSRQEEKYVQPKEIRFQQTIAARVTGTRFKVLMAQNRVFPIVRIVHPCPHYFGKKKRIAPRPSLKRACLRNNRR